MPARGLSARLSLLAAVCLLWGGGCAASGAPPGYLRRLPEAALDPYGAWIRLEAALPGKTTIQGEFIAVGEDGVFVLDGSTLREVAFANILSADMAVFDPDSGRAQGWVAMGAVSTVSHGLFLVCTLPVWLFFGGVSAGAHARAGLARYPQRTWDGLRAYARFPQGPPPDLRDLELRPRYHPAAP